MRTSSQRSGCGWCCRCLRCQPTHCEQYQPPHWAPHCEPPHRPPRNVYLHTGPAMHTLQCCDKPKQQFTGGLSSTVSIPQTARCLGDSPWVERINHLYTLLRVLKVTEEPSDKMRGRGSVSISVPVAQSFGLSTKYDTRYVGLVSCCESTDWCWAVVSSQIGAGLS